MKQEELQKKLDEIYALLEEIKPQAEKPTRSVKRYQEAGLSVVKLTYAYLKFKPYMKAKERDILSYVGELFTDPGRGIWALVKLNYMHKITDENDIVWCLLDSQMSKEELTNTEKKIESLQPQEEEEN